MGNSYLETVISGYHSGLYTIHPCQTCGYSVFQSVFVLFLPWVGVFCFLWARASFLIALIQPKTCFARQGGYRKFIFGGFHKWEYPQNGGFIVENTMKMNKLGVPLFQETSIWIYCCFLQSLVWPHHCLKAWDHAFEGFWCIPDYPLVI